MNGGAWAALAAAFISSPMLLWLIGFLWRRLRRDLKAEAEARKLNAEASRTEWATLYDEIKRLDSELADVRMELASVKREAADEKTELERENRRLRAEVSSLRTRVGQLEEIIKTKTTPEDMRAQLAEISRRTAKRDET